MEVNFQNLDRSRFCVAKTKSSFIIEALPETSSKISGVFGYPSTYRSATKDTFFNKTVVKDPYRWLEDPDDAVVKDWVNRQVDFTSSYMGRLETGKKKVVKELTKLWEYEKFGTPWKKGQRYFFNHNTGTQNQYVMYTCDSIDDLLKKKKRVLLDVNGLREDGTAAMKTYSVSEDGKYLAYAISYGGSDWSTIFLRDVEKAKDLPEVKLEWVKFSSISWTSDSRGFFYSRYPALDVSDQGTETTGAANQMIYFYDIKTNKSELVYSTPKHPKWMHSAEVTDCGKYLIITTCESCDPVNSVLLKEISSGKITNVVENFESEYSYLTNIGKIFYFKTNSKATRNRIISINIETLEMDEIVKETSDVLENCGVMSCGSKLLLVLVYLSDCKNTMKIRTLNGDGDDEKEIKLPSLGTIGAIRLRRDSDEMFYSFTSFLYPGTVYHLQFHKSFEEDLTQKVVFDMKVEGFDRDSFETKQIFYESKDGTRIPMFIVGPKDKASKPKPTVLYGYGGFNISLTPYFSVTRLCWMKVFSGNFVVANLRGGGEYGVSWHKAGQKTNKQNVFDDFIAAGEYLIKNGFTSSSQLAIMGGSNGGLLVSACTIQKPELFSCVICQVPVTDMLRFHKFTIGYAWTSDYGCADENEEEFKYMLQYSPLHNTHRIRDREDVPALMICTADHDDRVVPLHSYKLAAAMQYDVSPKNKRPILIRIDVNAGHGAGKPTLKVIEEYGELWSFVAEHTGCS